MPRKIKETALLTHDRKLHSLDEELLVIMAEECGEVSKECCKAYRFDIDTPSPHDQTTPRGRLELELGDILGVLHLLVKRGVVNQENILAQAKNKEIKVVANLRNKWQIPETTQGNEND